MKSQLIKKNSFQLNLYLHSLCVIKIDKDFDTFQYIPVLTCIDDLWAATTEQIQNCAF